MRSAQSDAAIGRPNNDGTPQAGEASLDKHTDCTTTFCNPACHEACPKRVAFANTIEPILGFVFHGRASTIDRGLPRFRFLPPARLFLRNGEP
jgi:hypothetical protein